MNYIFYHFKRLVFIFVTVAFSPWCKGQSIFSIQQSIPHFRQISLAQGLSQSTVYCIVQDTLGAMWFGTQDGLNRYDGEGFEVFQNNIQDSFSLQSNIIRALYIDHQGDIWIGGNGGLSIYNYISKQFNNYSIPHSHSKWFVSALVEDVSKNLWIGTTNGELWKYHRESDTITQRIYPASKHNIKSITSLVISGNKLWIGTDAGLFFMDLRSHKVKKVPISFEVGVVNCIVKDENNRQVLWIGTENNGLIHYNYSSSDIKHYKREFGSPSSLADNHVRTVGFDSEGRVWVGTFLGLSILDPTTHSFLNLSNNTVNPYSLSQNSVRSIFRDNKNGMWLGTYYGGLNYYHPNDIKFNNLSNNGSIPSLNDNVVSVIKEDLQGNLWIGTNDGGLNFWNKQTNIISYYVHDDKIPTSLSSNNIKSIIFDDNGNVLIGTHDGGLNCLNIRSGKNVIFKHNDRDYESISGNMVYALLKDSKGRIWVGTRNGLDLFLEEYYTFEHIYIDKAGKHLTSNEITYLFEDSRERIWIGTTNGVNIFYPDNRLFEPINIENKEDALSNGFVTSINEDNDGNIWIGTKNGLNLFHEENQSFTHFTKQQGLPNNVIYGILPDEGNNLWISTNKGLAKIELDNDYHVRTFTADDGLQSNQFNMYSFCKTSSGLLLFGGIKGISFFSPKDIKSDSINLQIKFTNLYARNKKVIPGDETDILTKTITQSRKLIFKPNLRQFRIEFRTFNYITPNKVSYGYRLLGFESDWHISKHATASYSNLPAGDYRFQAKAIGPLGKESTIKDMQISILSPWYQTTFAYIGFSLVFLIIAFFISRIIYVHIRERNQLQIERLGRKKMEEVNKMKAEFFTNISHEFRTPLTLIISPLEEILKETSKNDKLNKQLKLIYQNARRMLGLVDQLLDFRKAGYGKLELNLKQSDLVGFLHDIYLSFTSLAKKKNILYTFQSEEQLILTSFDQTHFGKVVFNLLSNAFKFTPEKGKISVHVSAKQGWAEISIKDSGCGIPVKFQSMVFDRFYRVDETHASPGSGIGLALAKRLIELHKGSINLKSKPHVGTIFTVKLPLNTEALPKESDNMTTNHVPIFIEEPIVYQQQISPPLNKDGKRQTILFVDDNSDILNYLSDSFADAYNVEIAVNGNQALDIITSDPPDFIVCDIMMPEYNGMKLCTHLKRSIKTCHIPLVLLTAKDGNDDHIKGLIHGADDYITKPFSIALLKAKIENILKSRRRLKEHYSQQQKVVPENIAVNDLDKGFLKEAMAVVTENIDNPDFSVGMLSKSVCMSRSNLYLKLKAITGESVSDFIKRIRFDKAVALIEENKYTMAEIAYMVGFSSSSYFSTSFKNYFGYLPTEHLKIKNRESI